MTTRFVRRAHKTPDGRASSPGIVRRVISRSLYAGDAACSRARSIPSALGDYFLFFLRLRPISSRVHLLFCLRTEPGREKRSRASTAQSDGIVRESGDAAGKEEWSQGRGRAAGERNPSRESSQWRRYAGSEKSSREHHEKRLLSLFFIALLFDGGALSGDALRNSRSATRVDSLLRAAQSAAR